MTNIQPDVTHGTRRVSRRVRGAMFVSALVVVAVVTGSASWWWRSGDGATMQSGVVTAFAAQADPLARAPDGVRVRVRVVNTTSSNGLARRATSVLRDHGFDVVEYEGDKRRPRTATLVQTHTGHSDWSDRVLRVLGTGTAEASTDSSHYVDVTVLLGQDWKAPAQAFRT